MSYVFLPSVYFRGKSSRLRIRKVSVSDTGTYSCRANNIIGSKQVQILVTVHSQVKETVPTPEPTPEPTPVPTPVPDSKYL